MTDLPVRDEQAELRARFVAARAESGLSQEEAAAALGISGSSVARKERGEQPVSKRDATAMEQISRDRRIGMVPRGTVSENGAPYGEAVPPGARFPLSALLRLPDVRARLSAIQSELIELGATPEYEENVMRTLRDRAFLSRFAGGSADDQYTEAELLQAIDNIAESARRFLAGPTL